MAGAVRLCSGHVYLTMNFQAASWGKMKLLNLEEVASLAHELGHAVHMLCYGGGGSPDFDDLPLDVVELPSTLAEVVAMHPGIIPLYARHHASGGPPPDSLIKSCQPTIRFFVKYLQSMNVALGLHGEGFDPHSATPAQLQQEAVALWQQYSPVAAHPSFTPLGQDAGMFLALGANQIAYLLCHLRADAVLHARQGQRAARPQDFAQQWLRPEFASRVRAQLLDRSFPAQQRRSSLLVSALDPAIGERSAALPHKAAALLDHPLPPLQLTAANLFSRLRKVTHVG